MSSSVGLGAPVLVPKMLPIAGTWTLPFAAYLLLLSNRVIYSRLKHEQYLGDRLKKSTTDEELNADPLHVASRAHLNFLENVPFAFVLAAIAELNGANRKIMSYSMAALFALRILHVEAGMRRDQALGLGRPIAYYGTQAWLAGIAGYSTYLVKGFWGY